MSALGSVGRRIGTIRSFREMDKVAIGVIGVVLVIAACAGAFAVGSLGLLADRYTMSGVFSEASGLKGGSDVRVAGVSVGSVKSLEADHDAGVVIVTWEVDSGIRLGPETRADVRINTLLGGEYLRLSGPVEAPYLEDLPAEERRIPLERTSVPFGVVETFGEATELVDAVDTDAANSLVTELADVAESSGADLERVLAGLEGLASAINSREAELDSLVGNSERLMSTLAEKDQAIVRLLDASDVLLTQISTRRDELARLLGDGSSAVRTLSALIAEREAELDAILADLHVLIGAVDRQQPNIDQALAWMGPTFLGVSQAGTHGPWLDVVVEAFGPDVLEVLQDVYPQLGEGG